MRTARPRGRAPGRPALVPPLPRPAWVVLAGDFLSAIGTGLTLPCLYIYAHQVRGLSSGAAGLVVSTIALASLAGNPIGGAAADRWTPRQALMGGLVVAAAGSVALALARSAVPLFGAAGLLGLGVAIIWPAQDALLASLAGSAYRSAVFSVRHATMNAGLGLGAVGAAAFVSVASPGTFTAVYLADALTFLAFLPILARLRVPPAAQGPASEGGETGATGSRGECLDSGGTGEARRRRIGFAEVLRDESFLRVWALTAALVTVSLGLYTAGFAGYATRPGGISTHSLGLAYAANMVTVVVAQLPVLRLLAGCKRTTGAALAAGAWAICWVIVLVGGHLGSGPVAALAFAAAMVVFGLGETLFSPTMTAVINDIAPPDAVGRYNGLGTLAFTTGFMIAPAAAGLALGAGWGTGLFAIVIVACAGAGTGALRLSRRLPTEANQITLPDTPGPGTAHAPSPTAALPR